MNRRDFFRNAGILGLTNLLNFPSQSESQEINDAMFILGDILEHNKDRTVRRLGHLNKNIAYWTSNSVRNTDSSSRMNIKPFEENPFLGSAASFWVYQEWRDFNGNKKLDLPAGKIITPKEMFGWDKDTFYEDESIYYRVATKNLQGHTLTFKLFDPNKKEIYADSPRVKDFLWLPAPWEGKPEGYLRENGEGLYYAMFSVDDQFLGGRGFKIKNSIKIYLGNYIEDFNHDNCHDMPGELICDGKTKFTLDEKITFVIETIRAKGKTVTIDLHSPKGQKITLASTIMPYEPAVMSHTLNARDIVEKNGRGTYISAFYVNGNYVDRKEFSIE